MDNRIGTYGFTAEPFHCDFTHKLFMGHLGNHILNAAEFHASDRNFGMERLMPINRTWVLSRLAVEMNAMPVENQKFNVSTWVESAMKYFTNRNFEITAEDGQVMGHARSIWAMIDTASRQPADILEVGDGEINKWLCDKPCPIAKPSRVKISSEPHLVRSLDTAYSDIDVNGHVNSVKYIDHVLDLFPASWYKTHILHRLDVAYVAEAYAGDHLHFYIDNDSALSCNVSVTKSTSEGETEVCRCALQFEE